MADDPAGHARTQNLSSPTTASSGAAVELTDVSKWFGAFQVLSSINLIVGQRERIVICGPSGSGKSTLIRCINRLETHQAGRIVVDGIELTEDPILRFRSGAYSVSVQRRSGVVLSTP